MLKMTLTDFGGVSTVNTAESEVLNCSKSCQTLYFASIFHHLALILWLYLAVFLPIHWTNCPVPLAKLLIRTTDPILHQDFSTTYNDHTNKYLLFQ